MSRLPVLAALLMCCAVMTASARRIEAKDAWEELETRSISDKASPGDDNADDAYGREQKQGYENDVAQHRVEAVCARLGVSCVSEHGGSVLLCVCWKSISFVAVS